MKRVALVLTILGLLLLIAVGAYLLLVRDIEGEPEPGPAGSDPFGFLPGASGSNDDTLPLTLDDGSTVSVPDFTASNQPDWAGESSGYQVAGDADGDFLITYIPADQFGSQAQFLISLLQEPLGEVRRRAESALKVRLGISEQELCGLDAQVWTGSDVNETYAGYDLGLSFCPGATVLP